MSPPIIELSAAALPASAHRLFDDDLPNAAIRRALLAGTGLGHAVLDDAARPTWCLVRTAYYGFAFLGGSPDAATLAAAIDRLRRRGRVSLVVRDEEHARSIDAPPPTESVERREFSGRAERAAEWAARTPDGFGARRLDGALLAKCRWRDAMVETFGSAKRYLADSLGTCLVDGGAVASEAHAAFLAPGLAEIGGITAPYLRGAGLAPSAAAHLVLACAERGAETVWSCDRKNAASARVAEKLGYARERAYRLLDYPRLGPAAS